MDSDGLPSEPLFSPKACQLSTVTQPSAGRRSEEHTSELQSPCNLVCRLLLEKKNFSTPLITLFLLVLILLLMPTLNILPLWFTLILLLFRLPSRLPMMLILWMVAMMVIIIPSRTVGLLTSFPVRRAIMFMLVSWFGLTLPLLNAADWFR